MAQLKLVTLKKLLADWWLNYYEATYQNSKQEEINYHFVSREANLTTDNLKHPVTASAVTMFCLNRDHSQVLLLRQFRLPLNDYVYGNSAGLIEPGETVEQAIERELVEETGYQGVHIDQIFNPSYSTPGITDGAITLAICTIDQIPSQNTALESAEELTSIWVDKKQAAEILASGKISGRTQLLLWQWVNNRLN